MNILYINPSYKKRNASRFYPFAGNPPSLTLKQLAAITPKKDEIEIVDERFNDIKFHRDYDLICITSLTYNSTRAYEIAEKFKKMGKKVVIGGYHSSLLSNEAKKYCDSVLIGEAEYTLPKLLQDVENKRLKPFYKQNQTVKPADIPEANHEYGTYNNFCEPIQAARGCPMKCNFCAQHIIEGNTFRGRPINDVVNEIKKIKQKFVYFTDASLNTKNEYYKELFKNMKNLDKKCMGMASIRNIKNDDEFLKYASEAGIISLYFGIESLPRKGIKNLSKSLTDIEEYKKIFSKVKDYGINTYGFLIFGFDSHTVETFNYTYQAISEMKLDGAMFLILTPFPGTDIFEKLDGENRIINKEWKEYEETKLNIKPKNMNNKELINGIRDTANRYYSFPNIIKRSIRNIKSPLNMIFQINNNIEMKIFYKYF